MNEFHPEYYFDLTKCDYAELFDGVDIVWNALKRLQETKFADEVTAAKCKAVTGILPPDLHTVGSPEIRVNESAHVGPFVTVYGKSGGTLCIDSKATVLPGTVITVGSRSVYIGREAIVGPNATIDASHGSVCIGASAEVRQGSCVRQSVLMSKAAQVGVCCEIKCALLGQYAEVLHHNYVGDSLLGYKAHTGAGAKLSNFKLTSTAEEHETIKLRYEGEVIDTGLTKFGAIMGDRSQLGCNSVANPGTLLGWDVFTYTGSNVSGLIPADTIMKLRQTIERDSRRD